MPKCYGCKKSTPGDELREFGSNNRGWPEDELGCTSCRRKRLVTLLPKGAKLNPVPGGYKITKTEREVTVSERKPIASIQIVPSVEADNYDIVGYVRIGGMKLELDTDVEKIRSFFTKRRERNARKESRVRKAVEEANAELITGN